MGIFGGFKNTNRIRNIFKSQDRGEGIVIAFIKDIKLTIAMFRDYRRGEYKDLSKWSVILILFAIAYVISPIDLFPDFLIGFGIIDDIALINFVLMSLNEELESYSSWLERKETYRDDVIDVEYKEL